MLYWFIGVVNGFSLLFSFYSVYDRVRKVQINTGVTMKQQEGAATLHGYLAEEVFHHYKADDDQARATLVDIFNKDENAELLLANAHQVLQQQPQYIRSVMGKHYRKRLLKCLSNDRSDIGEIRIWLQLLVKAASGHTFQYETSDKISPPIWLQLFGAMRGLLASQAIEDAVKKQDILPFCKHWLAAFQPTRNFVDHHLAQFIKFAIAIEAYLATQPTVDFPYAPYAKLLTSAVSEGSGFSDKEKRDFFCLVINRFLRNPPTAPEQWESFATVIESYSEASRFISVYFHKEYLETILLLLYQVPKMAEADADEGVLVYQKRIVQKMVALLQMSRSFPELLQYEDKHVVVASVLSSANDFATEHTKADDALQTQYYKNTSWSTRLTFCGLGILTALVLVFYALVAAKAITGHSFLFLTPYFFLLHGVVGLVLPAATLVAAFIVYHAYHEIFSLKQEPFSCVSVAEPIESEQITANSTWLHCIFGVDSTQGPGADVSCADKK
jgi:hypothetical protein